MKKRWPTVDAEIHSRVTPEVKAHLEEIAMRRGISLSNLIRQEMNRLSEREKKKEERSKRQ